MIEAGIAFAAGVVSFASPCTLPVVPAWIGYVVGGGEGRSGTRRGALLQSLAFVAGFTVVFVVLWASIGFMGHVLQAQAGLLRQIGGAVLIVIGLHVAGLIRIPFLTRTVSMSGKVIRPGAAARPPSLGRSALLGVVFGAGWTPCVGPTLAAIIGMASLRDSVGQGAALLAIYAFGLGLPFVLVALGANAVRSRLSWFARHEGAVSIVTGCLLMVVGFLMITNLLARLSQYFPQLGA